MARRRRNKLPPEPFVCSIEDLAHDGRGVARVEGKTVFVHGALPGERVEAVLMEKHRNYDVATTERVLEASPDRVEPRCAVYGVCGGCALQHLHPDRQVEAKQDVLLENFRRIGKVTPAALLEPLRGPVWGYRRKARMGVRYVERRDKVMVGFRERRRGLLADMARCEVLYPSIGEHLGELGELIYGMEARTEIAQVEVLVDDNQTALCLRNLKPLSVADTERLIAWGKARDIHLFLQPGGPDTVAPLWPEQIDLSYSLPDFDVSFRFGPTDFTQVNLDINRAMVARAVEMLAPSAEERVLDLFCGLGNFTLPLARRAREVVGVEGSAQLVQRAQANATANGITNAQFHTADLSVDLSGAPWWGGGFDKVLLDPSRDGAEQTLAHIAALGVGRIVYVSCNPATLARDAGILVNQFGYVLEQAGVMDMFPHTAHVESIALFTLGRRRKS